MKSSQRVGRRSRFRIRRFVLWNPFFRFRIREVCSLEACLLSFVVVCCVCCFLFLFVILVVVSYYTCLLLLCDDSMW